MSATHVQSDAERLTSPAKPKRAKVVHIAPGNSLTLAQEMGVQYKARCGRWIYPTGTVIAKVHALGDMRPETCKACRRVVASILARANQ